MQTVEIYENLSTATANTNLPVNYNGWTTNGNNVNLGIIMDGTDKVLTGKGNAANFVNGSLHKQLISAGEFGRVECKLKINNLDFSATPGDYLGVGFYTDADPSANLNAKKRLCFLSESGNLQYFDGTTQANFVNNANIPVGQWLTVGIASDGTGKYTVYACKEDGTLLGSVSFTVAADTGIPLYAYVLLGGLQGTYDANGWGTQFYIKDIIARNDFKQYNEATQRRHLRFRPTINGEEPYITIPSSWNPGVSGRTKAIALGHGYAATANFELYGGINYVNDGFVYASSNVHGDSWGNAQAVADMETLRQWLVSKTGCDEKIILTGYSMGGLNAFNYASQYPAKVDRIITEAGVANVAFEYPDYKSSIDAAYSSTRYEDIPKSYDPMQNAEKLCSIPLICWVGNADTAIYHDMHTRLLVEKVARLGGKAAYLEEDGETHSVDWDYARNLDFMKAYISQVTPNLFGTNLVEATTELTQLVTLAPNAVYKITTSADNIISYVLDNEDGTQVAISGKETTIKTKGRRMMVLLKLTNVSYSFTNVTLTRIR